MNSDSTGLTSGFWHLTNPDLKPEKLSTQEVSINYLVHKTIQLTANVYYNQIKNLIVTDVTFGETFKGVVIDVVERNINKGSANTYDASFSAVGNFKIGEKNNISRAVGSNLPYLKRSTIHY
jgi:outer membrane cobalamin receptor